MSAGRQARALVGGLDEDDRDEAHALAEMSLSLLCEDIRSRGMDQFQDAIEAARKKVASMSDEKLKSALFDIGGEARGRRNSGAIKVQPTAPGRRASTGRGRAPLAPGRPKGDAGPQKKRKLSHSLKQAVDAGRRGSYKH